MDEIEQLEEQVRQGNATAMCDLARMYEDGRKITQNYAKAKELYEKAVELGNSNAMFNLALMYDMGQGIAQDYSKAKELYEKATILGNSYALCNLAYMYIYGQGVSKDYAKARKLYEKAVELGDSEAMFSLALMYQKGLGVSQDYSKAKELYEKAVELGDSEAMFSLALMYQKGLGVSQDYSKAKELYEKAVELGNSNAMFNLALMYKQGESVSQDYDKARKLLEKAVELGDANAMFSLGLMYEKGQGVSQDYDRAKKLYELAANLGMSKAKEKIKILEEKINANIVPETDTKELIKETPKVKLNPEIENLRSLNKELSDKYIARSKTVRMLLNSFYHNNKVKEATTDKKKIRDNISTILLISSTGGGKTAIVSDLAKKFGVPFQSSPLSMYTPNGYKGVNLQDIFLELIKKADGDVKKAEEGIVLLDEFDKIRISEDVEDKQFPKALQRELLSYLDGREVQLDKKISTITFDTSKVTFIFAGAFQDITEYSNDLSTDEIKNLISIGYETELLGRIGVYHYMPKYTKEDYINILNNSTISPLSNFVFSCSLYGKNVITSPYSQFVESVAEEAVYLGEGVRGLNSIFQNILNWYLDDLIYGDSDIVLLESYQDIKRKKGRGM